ncbi:MAG TPA: hypothetical protein VJT71_09415 [Pyrinomonadaceae bacterium]|nr:hypothetical protein [Pyrinomonadaceae bacterium]
MISVETVKIILTVISGVCWTIVYIDGIRLGLRDKSYAIPFYALALNFAWETLYTFYGFRINGVDVQNVINAIWLTFDIGILYTYFKFGRKYFSYPPAHAGGTDKRYPPAHAGGTDKRYAPAHAGGTDKSRFIAWSVLGLVSAFALEYAILREFGVAKGAAYSAFPQNLLMSMLFIAMLAQRGNREGQSVTIAVSKWLGTLAPTIVYGVLGEGGFPRGSFLILVFGIFCSIFDLLYIRLLAKAR